MAWDACPQHKGVQGGGGETAEVAFVRVRVRVCVCTQSCLTLCDPVHWDPLSAELSHQAILSMGLSWQEHCNGWPLPSPGDLPNPGI